MFGRKPLQVIPCVSTVTEVIETFCEEPPSQQVFLITGVCGSGKTVLMTEVSQQLDSLEEWVVVELNPERDTLQSLRG